MSRPTELLRRPDKISIYQGIVTCRYNQCFYSSGPHLSRDDAVLIAQDHYQRCHHSPTHHRRRSRLSLWWPPEPLWRGIWPSRARRDRRVLKALRDRLVSPARLVLPELTPRCRGLRVPRATTATRVPPDRLALRGTPAQMELKAQ